MLADICSLDPNYWSDFYDWEIPKELDFIWDILTDWFDNYKEFGKIIKKIYKEPIKRWTKIDKRKIKNLQKELKENFKRYPYICWDLREIYPELDDDYEIEKRIRYLLFLKYINIFYSLSCSSKIELTPFLMRAIVANILNWKLNCLDKNSILEKYTFFTNKSLVSLFQSMHGDLTIDKYSLWEENHALNSNQLDLFYSSEYENGRVINLNLDSTELDGRIWIHQRTSGFLKVILFFCYKYKFFPQELNPELLNIKWEIPNAWDALDIKEWWYFFSQELDDSIMYEKDEDFIISHSPNISLFANITEEWIYVKQKDWKIRLKIEKEEIWPIVRGLMYLPCRSYNQNILILKEFFKKIEKEHNK